MTLTALSAASLAMLHDEPWQIIVAMAGLSVGVGFSFASMAALVTEAVDPTETGIATGINTVMRTVGAVIGAQVGAVILTATTLDGTAVPTESAYVTAFLLSAVGRHGRGARRDLRDPGAAAAPRRARRGGRMSGEATPTQGASPGAVEGLLDGARPAAAGRGRPGARDRSRRSRSITLMRLADTGPVRLGSLADALGTTDATASRNVDALERAVWRSGGPTPATRAA